MVTVTGTPNEVVHNQLFDIIIKYVGHKFTNHISDDYSTLCFDTWYGWITNVYYIFMVEEKDNKIYITVNYKKYYDYCYSLAEWIEHKLQREVIIERDW